jgi:hypothetical protein
MHCGDGLRCFDLVCRPQPTAVLGELYVASGERARAAGDDEGAIAGYTEAMKHYGTDVPLAVDCAYGGVLAAAAKNKDRAELAARVLHRCVLAAPVGSHERAAAMRDLAGLFGSGLDPQLIARTQLADVYLTQAPKGPDKDAVKVKVTADGKTKAKPYLTLVDQIATMRDVLLPCWTAYQAATGKGTVAVTLALRSRFVETEFEETDRHVVKFAADPPTDPSPESVAAACVQNAVNPSVQAIKNGASTWDATIAVVLE